MYVEHINTLLSYCLHTLASGSYTISSHCIQLYTSEKERNIKRLNNALAAVTTYDAWVNVAKQLDNLEGTKLC